MDKTITVSALLQERPGADKVFFHLRTACVGCSMARFCTLEDVAEQYHLDLETLLGELETASPKVPSKE
jgi:hybrid cluster-associated redox disulfide protein